MFKIDEKGKRKEWDHFALELFTSYYWDEGAKRNLLHLAAFGYYLYIKIPPIIKPKMVKNSTIQRRYGFSVSEDCVYFSYGIQPGCWTANDPKNSDHTKLWSIPWKNYYRVEEKIILPNPDGSEDILNGTKSVLTEDWHKERGIIKNHTKHVFIFNDFDGEEIVARVHRTYSTYRVNGGKRSGFWGFLTYILKDRHYNHIEIDFDKEVGERKGSWKGGTLRIHSPMEAGENFEEAFKRIMTAGGRDGKATNIRYLGVM